MNAFAAKACECVIVAAAARAEIDIARHNYGLAFRVPSLDGLYRVLGGDSSKWLNSLGQHRLKRKCCPRAEQGPCGQEN